MGFLKKLFGFGKKEEDKDDDEIIDEPNEIDDDDSINVDDAEVIDKPLEITDEEPEVNKDEINGEPAQYRNFKYLDDLVHSGVKEIVLDADIVLGDDERSDYNEGIKLDVDDFIIDGNGHKIDAQGKTRIFKSNGKNVTIKNLILKNGFTESSGGAIYNSGELTIKETTFDQNRAKAKGGSIYNHGQFTISGGMNPVGDLKISESKFNKNTAINGGAIINRGNIKISQTLFNENRADVGGAISNHQGNLIISESIFKENTAQKLRGGAIYDFLGVLEIYNSTLSNNFAKEYGGAINLNGELTISGSTLNENSSKCGAAISNHGNLKVSYCEISNNKSTYNIINNSDFTHVFNTIFKNNQSKHTIINEGDRANLSLLNGEFKFNSVSESVIFNNGKNCTIEKSIFEKNLSPDCKNIINKSNLTLISPKIKDEGITVFNANHLFIRKSSQNLLNKISGGGKVEIEDDIIPDNEKFDFGYLDKIIHLSQEYEDNHISITFDGENKIIKLKSDLKFENYEKYFYEGGIELDIDDLIIDGNGHTINGLDKSRIFIITGNNITLKNITFKNGSTYKNYNHPLNNHGGAIKINLKSNLTIIDCKFLDNSSEGDGGAIRNRGDLSIKDSALAENNARRGGAISNSGKLLINESSFNRNLAKSCGGAVDNLGPLAITKSMINENKASFGGAIYNHAFGELKIFDSEINKNMANSGGAIENKGGDLIIKESTLNENSAMLHHGGAIVNQIKFFDNTETSTKTPALKYDGSVNVLNQDLWYKIAKLSILNSEINKNRAKSAGGGIYLQESKYESSNCTFKDNQPDDIYEEKD